MVFGGGSTASSRGKPVVVAKKRIEGDLTRSMVTLHSRDSEDRRPAPSDDRITAFYCRITRADVRDHEKLETALERQTSRSRELAREKGWLDFEVYEEPPNTSAELPFNQRPAAPKLLQAVREGRVERIVLADPDRLMRDPVLAEEIIALLRAHEVELWSFYGPLDVKNEAGRLALRIKGAVAKYEIESTQRRLREQRRSAARAGHHQGPAPHGYTSRARALRESRASAERDGESVEQAAAAESAVVLRCPERGVLYRDDNEAPILEEAFRLADECGWGQRRIANHLHALGHRTRMGNRISGQLVNRWLRNPVYAGYTSNDEAAFKAQRNTRAQRHRQDLHEGRHEALVDRDRWHRVQLQIDHHAKYLSTDNRVQRIYALTPVMTCSCGSSIRARSRSRSGRADYACRRKVEFGKEDEDGCDVESIRWDVAEGMVRQILTELFADPRQLYDAVQEAHARSIRKKPEDLQRKSAISRQIRETEARLEKCTRLWHTAEPGSIEEQLALQLMKDEKESLVVLAQQKAEVEGRLLRLPPRLSMDDVTRWVEQNREGLLGDARAFKRLLQVTKVHHDLRVVLLPGKRLRVSLLVTPTLEGGPRDGTRLEAESTVSLSFEDGAPSLSSADWAQKEQGKHLCACGCGQPVVIKPIHRARSKGIPAFIHGHNRAPAKTRLEALNQKGLVTLRQAATRLGIGATTLRRQIDQGLRPAPTLQPWDSDRTVSTYLEAELPALRAALAEIGLGSAAEKSIGVTELARRLGVTPGTVRRWERQGRIPKASTRDSAGRRRYSCRDVKAIQAALAR